MCGTSKYFSYSDVARGQPGQNCTIAIEKFMDEVARKAAGTYWTFSSVLFLFFVYITWFAYRKEHHHQIESPLLWRDAK